MSAVLLDHRYLVSSLVSATARARRFAGCHVGLDAPVRIVEMRPPDEADEPDRRRAGSVTSVWDAARCASLAARTAALHHPALPRVRDCFCAGGICFVVEDASDGERLIGRGARGAKRDLRAALRDGLHLCDAVARVAADVPEMLACLLIASATLAYDADGLPHVTTWDYACWSGGQGTLDPGEPDLRAPELLTGGRAVPDERAHVYSIAALLMYQLTGSARLPAASADGILPDSVRTALEPALRADPRLRTPTADALGRALARAACAALPALEPAHTEGMASFPPPIVDWGDHKLRVRVPVRASHPYPPHPRAALPTELARRATPRAIRQARGRPRAAVEAALRRAGRALKGSSCA